MTKDEALRMALDMAEWLTDETKPTPTKTFSEIAAAIREVLAQPNNCETAALLAVNKDLKNHFDALMDDYQKLSALCTRQGIRLMDAEDDRQSRTAQQKPFCYHDGRNIVEKEFANHSDVFPLYTSPLVKSTWVELDHDDIHSLMNEFFYTGMQPSGAHFANFARSIEAKLKEKNT